MLVDAQEITPVRLTDRLRHKGRLNRGKAVRVERGESFESTGATWTPLTVEYEGDDEDAPRDLIHQRRHRERFNGGFNETVLLSDFAAQMSNPPVVVCYDFDYDESTRDIYMLLQDASKTHKSAREGLTTDDYCEAAKSLLEFHVHWWEHGRLNEPRFDRTDYGPQRMADACSRENIEKNARHWRDDLLQPFLDKNADKLPPGGADTIARATEQWADVFGKRVEDGRALTLIHSDAHVMNQFFPRDSATQKALLVDWETFRRGLGAFDLAYMMYFREASHRQELEAAVLPYYYERLVASGVPNYSREDFEQDYRLSIIACLFPALSWVHGGAQQALQAFEDWNCGELLD